jgi:hypothetical protein
MKQPEASAITNQMEIALLQYKFMREEIMAKIKVSHDLGYYKLITLGSTLGLAFSREQVEHIGIIILVALVLPLVFDAALFFNGNAIIKAGNYIRVYLEPFLHEMGEFPGTFRFWEKHIELEGKNEYSRKPLVGRKWWNLFESVQPIGTLVLQIMIFLHINELFSPWMRLVAALAVSIEVLLVVLGLCRH